MKRHKKLLKFTMSSVFYIFCFFVFCAICSYFDWSINEFKESAYSKKGYYQAMTISGISDYYSWLFQLPLRHSVTPKMLYFFELGNAPYEGMSAFVLSLIIWGFISIPLLIVFFIGLHIYNIASEYIHKNEKTVINEE